MWLRSTWLRTNIGLQPPRLLRLAGILFCGLQFLCSGEAVGQDYETLPVSERYLVPKNTGDLTGAERAELLAKISEVKQNITGDVGDVADCLKSNVGRPENFDRFFKEFVFAEMSQTTEENLAELGARRAEFLRRFLAAEMVGANRTHLIEELLLPTLSRVAEGNFHPAVRLNAVLLIGLANSAEGNANSNEAPVPNAACVRYLISLAKQEQLPTYLKVGVFTGLHRVAQIEGVRPRLAPAEVVEIATQARAIVENKSPGQQTWDPEAGYWLLRRAIQILGFLRDPGENGAVVEVLYQLLRDENRDMLARLDAIEALGQLNYPAASNARVKEVSLGVAQFVSQALTQQADKIRSDIEELIGMNLLNSGVYLLRGGIDGGQSGGGKRDDQPGAGMGGMDGGGNEGTVNQKDDSAPIFDMPNYYLNTERRRCKHYIFVCQSLFAPNGKWYQLASDNERALIDQVRTALDEVMEKSDTGLVDLGKRAPSTRPDNRESVVADTPPEKRKSVAWEMINLLENSGKRIKEILGPAQPPAAGTVQ